jgi:hypothetical protein
MQHFATPMTHLDSFSFVQLYNFILASPESSVQVNQHIHDELLWPSKPTGSQGFLITISGVLILVTANIFCDVNYSMAPHSTAEEEESTTSVPTTEGGLDWEEYDEEEMNAWRSTAYVRGSKQPMKKPLTEPWGLAISDADVEKLKVGFKSRDMDDKWDMLVEDPDENGGISIHILRSWHQEPAYILHIVPKPSNDDSKSAEIQRFTWEGNKGGWECGAEQAQKEAVMLCRGHLECEFETLPEYPSTDFWDSNAYKAAE